MRRITMLALAVVLALTGSACGGDDDDSGGEDTESGSTTTPEEGDDGGDDDGGSPSGDALAEAISGMGGCTQAAAAVSASIVAGFNPQAAEELEENRAFFDDFESSVPDDIADEVSLMKEYVDAYGDVLSDYTAQDYTDPEKAAEIGQAFEDLEDDFDSEDVQAASDAISDWFTEECPGVAGT